ncbi:DNA methyltransferase [Arthrobacter phage Shambre1]|uniref:DNA methyltransferase n=1 Tax=Arthrobacter phage Shambre1 TaxID=2927284 RepID=A0A977KNL4_9CAUD|nr:DNA methyltransferase [Arthrobacter phage Shambre1]UXE04772.1 DNA methyltransferase [Arthrobacter phage Shambre1]
MKVLVACEYSGIVRDAFLAAGHDAISCDLLPTEKPGPHYLGDVRDILYAGWDLMIGHPECTFLTNSGAQWLYEAWTAEEKAAHLAATGKKLRGRSRRRDEARWEAMHEAVKFYRLLWEAPIGRIALENPTMHGHASRAIGGGPTQTIQPWWFGTPESKATGLRLKNLPPLVADADADKTLAYGLTLPKKVFQRVHNLPPSPTRWIERSRTFPGVARAMAEQWGPLGPLN